MALFFIGLLEMIIVTLWTKMVTKTRVIASGLVTWVNVMIWYYVLQMIVDDINNWRVAMAYALGCAVGTVLTTAYFSWEKKTKRQKRKIIKNIKVILASRLVTKEGKIS